MKQVFIIVLVATAVIGTIFFFRSNSEEITTDESQGAEQSTEVAVEEACAELAKLARQNARDNVFVECNKYLNKTCIENGDCGAFPCVNGQCLVQPCDSDRDCPGPCGLNLTPVPGFCTTTDAK